MFVVFPCLEEIMKCRNYNFAVVDLDTNKNKLKQAKIHLTNYTDVTTELTIGQESNPCMNKGWMKLWSLALSSYCCIGFLY